MSSTKRNNQKEWKYFTEESLTNLVKHKYSCRDDSILAKYCLTPFWNYCLNFVPLGIAPNMITIIGTLGIVLNTLVVWYYCPNMIADSSTPTWICLLSGVLLFFYQTMDNLDGKQARRTGTSSPMGEMTDHGCDSLVVTMTVVICSSLGSFGMGWVTLFQLLSCWMLFWASTWEQYHTGVLYLGIVNGPDEGIVGISAIFIYTYFVGYAIWGTSLTKLFPGTFGIIPDMTFRYFVCLITVLPALITTVYTFFSVTKKIWQQGKSSKDAVMHQLTFALFAACVITWFYLSPSMWMNYPRGIIFTLGVIFGEMVSRLIIAHICEQPFGFLQRPMVPFLMLTVTILINSVNSVIPEKWIVIGFAVASWSSYIHFITNVWNELSTYLNFPLFTMPAYYKNKVSQ